MFRRAFLALLGLSPFAARYLASAAHAEAAAVTRITYEASWKRLVDLGYINSDLEPVLPDHRPEADDSGPHGFQFFRTEVVGEDLSGLTLRRAYFGRSLVERTSFRNADLSESNLCWNDFIDVSFESAVLAGSDLRSSQFERTNFDHADLKRADFRHSSLRACSAVGADLTGAVMTANQARQLNLSPDQSSGIELRTDEGPEPAGG
jgi:BTB/POZ domain-containing protein KCTD9